MCCCFPYREVIFADPPPKKEEKAPREHILVSSDFHVQPIVSCNSYRSNLFAYTPSSSLHRHLSIFDNLPLRSLRDHFHSSEPIISAVVNMSVQNTYYVYGRGAVNSGQEPNQQEWTQASPDANAQRVWAPAPQPQTLWQPPANTRTTLWQPPEEPQPAVTIEPWGMPPANAWEPACDGEFNIFAQPPGQTSDHHGSASAAVNIHIHEGAQQIVSIGGSRAASIEHRSCLAPSFFPMSSPFDSIHCPFITKQAL